MPFSPEFEEYLRTSFASDLLQSVIKDTIDVDQIMVASPELADMDLQTALPVEQAHKYLISDELSQVTKPIGQSRTYQKATNIVGRVEVLLKEVGVSLEYPVRQLKKEFPAWLKAETGLNKPDLNQMAIVREYIMSIIRGAVANDFARNMWWNNRTSHNQFLYGYNGIWASYFNRDTDLSQVAIDNLPEDPSTASSTDVIGWLRTMYNFQSPDMDAKEATRKRMYVTQEIYNAIYRAYTDKGLEGSGLSYIQRTEAPQATLAFHGMPIRKMSHWTGDIKNYDPAGAGKGKYEQRILMFVEKEFMVGVNQTESDAFVMQVDYDSREETNLIKTSYYADTTLKREKYVVVAVSAKNTPFIIGRVPTDPATIETWPYKDIDNNLIGGIDNSSDANVAVAAGDTVTIRGNNLGATGTTVVTVGATAQADVTVVNDHTLTFTATGTETTAAVEVDNGEGGTTAVQTMTIS